MTTHDRSDPSISSREYGAPPGVSCERPWKGGLWARLQHQSTAHGDKILLRVPGRDYSYADFRDLAEQRSHALQQAGVAQGDVVAVMLPNGIDFLTSWFALQRIGAIHFGIEPELAGDLVNHMLTGTGASYLITSSTITPYFTAVPENIKAILSIDSPLATESVKGSQVVNLEKIDTNGTPSTAAEVSLSSPAMLVSTSGTTGYPKAVTISHGYALHMASERIIHYELTSKDVCLSMYPLVHTSGSIYTFLVALHAGATCAIIPKFSASRFWDQVREFRASYTIMLGVFMTILWTQPRRHDDAENPLRIVASAPTPGFWNEFEDRFGVRCISTYGASECCVPIVDSLSEGHVDGFDGKTCEHHEVQIVDDDGSPVPNGEVGEILVRPRVPHGAMSGYWGQPDTTVENWTNLWYHTGDVGCIDAEGNFKFVGRSGEALRRRGRNISAQEVEDLLCRHPKVEESCVIGVPSALTEDDLKAVLRLSGPLAIEDLVQWLKATIPRHYSIRYIEIVDEIPKTPTGKARRSVLRQQWRTVTTFDIDTQRYFD